MRGPQARDAKPFGVVRLLRNRTTVMVVLPKAFLRVLQWRAGDHVAVELLVEGLWIKSLQSEVERALAARPAAQGSLLERSPV